MTRMYLQAFQDGFQKNFLKINSIMWVHFVTTLLKFHFVPAADLGQTCSESNECRSGSGGYFSICYGYYRRRCACNSGYSDTNGDLPGGKCIPGIGKRCLLNGDCAELNPDSECRFGICECKDGWTDSNGSPDYFDIGGTGGICVANVLGSECSSNKECSVHNPTWVCKCFAGNAYICQCACTAGYTDNNGDDIYGGTCFAHPGTVCTSDDNCTTNSVCQSGICTCVTGLVDSNGDGDGGICVESSDLGRYCRLDSDCTKQNPHAKCISNLCRCRVGWKHRNYILGDEYPEGHGFGGVCVANVLGSECSSNKECSAHSPTWGCKCFVGNARICQCACMAGYTDTNGDYIYGGTCLAQPGTVCASDGNCTTNSVCLSGTCACVNGSMDNNGDSIGGLCMESAGYWNCSNVIAVFCCILTTIFVQD